MKKRRFAKLVSSLLAIAMLLSAACALGESAPDTTTPRRGIAVAAPREASGTVPMFEKASEDSAVLMEYYSGALMEVVGLTGTGMVHVQCGEKGASVMGYMRARDLRYGAQAMREVPKRMMAITLNREAAVQSYPDARAIELWRYDAEELFIAISRSDEKWVQLYVEPQRFNYEHNDYGAEYENGFVHLPTGAATGEFVEWAGYRVLPVEGELSFEEAYERAIEIVLSSHESIARDFPTGLSREELEAMNCQWWLYYNKTDDTAMWSATFFDPQDIERDVGVVMNADGSEGYAQLGNG